MRYLLLAALLLPALAHAESVFVYPTTGVGFSEADLTTVTELVKTSIHQVSKDGVLAGADGADIELQPRLLKLGESIILSITKTRHGENEYSSELKATRMEELDKIAKVVTRAVLNNEQAAEEPHVDEITKQEAHEGTLRKPVRRATYLGFGPSWFSNLNRSGPGLSLGISYSWDANFMRIKIFGEGDFRNAAFFASGGVAGEYFFTETAVAPYVSADFGGGAAKIDSGAVLDGATVGGFVVGWGAGVEFLRTSAVNLDLGFRAAYLLHDNQYGMPEVYSLRLGLYF